MLPLLVDKCTSASKALSWRISQLEVTIRLVHSMTAVRTRQLLTNGPCLQTPVTPNPSIYCLHLIPAIAPSAFDAKPDLLNCLYSLMTGKSVTTGGCEVQTQSTYQNLLRVSHAAMHGLLQGSTALMAAAAWGHVTVVKLLLIHRADSAMKNKKV